jgi:site-specific DNA recombinase
MPIAATYGRISMDEQRPTSIDDQLRRCREVATREGLSVEDRLAFADVAITGTAKGTRQRVQYQRMLDALRAGECTVVIADEISRLTRHISEGAMLMDLVEERGVRFLTHDGIDTARKGWRLLWMLKLMGAAQEVESTSDRTVRGMYGQLDRGYQIAKAPYGYRPERVLGPKGKLGGTLWHIDEAQAEVVRRIFQWRFEGASLLSIAARLQRDGVPPPAVRRCRGVPFWRPGSVYRVLDNAIYRGTFVWHGSSFTRTKARKKRQEVETAEFARPALRLVSDELWFACNGSRASSPDEARRSPRGGGRHYLSGLVRCGDCRALLSVHGGPASFALYCPQCASSTRVGGKMQWMGYSSAAAARQALEFVLRAVFGPQAREEFHRRLKAKLQQGPAAEELALRERLAHLRAVMARLKMLAMDLSFNPDELKPELDRTSRDIAVASQRLEVLGEHAKRLTPQVLACQLAVEPLELLHELLNSNKVEPYQVRATLHRLLQSFELIARPAPGCSRFRIGVLPGVCVAEFSDTPVIDAVPAMFEVTVSTTKRRPVVWTVEGKRV